MKLNTKLLYRVLEFAFLFVALIFVSCKKDETKADVYYNFTLNAGQPSDDGYPISEGLTWNSSDQIAAINVTMVREIEKLSYNTSSQKFSGNMVNILSGNNLAFFYPASALTTEHSDTITQDFSVMSQDGTESTVLNYRYGFCSSVTLNELSASATATMEAILAVAKMKFLHNGSPINDIVKIEFRAKEGNVYGKRTFNFRKKAYESGTNNNMVIKNNQGLDGSAVLAMIPTDDVLLEASVFTADGSIYVGNNNDEGAIEAGNLYDWTFDCTKENGLAHIGDYFYSDMTVSSELNENKKCIGIVFALTDTEDGDINRTLTSSYHGRIVALNDVNSTGKTWSTMQYNIKGMPDFSTADGSLEEGFLPYWDGKSSSSYFESGHINIALTEDGRIETWPSSGLLSDFNGKENTAYADSSAIVYGACGQAAAYSISGITNKRWYCPSGGEMALLYAQSRLGILSSETLPPFTNFEARGYWCAAEREENRAWYIQFATGGVYANYKLSSYFVRPLMHF